ncbi:MAG TPA: LacI family DNA-binding transcriptional regulator, partial [Bacteroidia bacterium]|nr:LacI family DNA-binding transcriptional regulator [Bacteroidia bacterium]
MKKVSLNDLAKALNLSKTLVSFVMNGKGDAYGINPETQKKVQAMAKKMNYRPNLIARGLRTGKSNLLGLIVSDIGNPFYSRISRAVEAEAEKHGYYMMVCSTDENETREKRLVQMLLEEQGVNGLIISTSQHDPEYFRELKKSGYPLVLIDRSINGLKIDYVGVDNYKGGFEATMQLLNVGYKKIAMLRISPSFLSTINDRARGYMDALKERGIKPDPKLIREIPFDDIREKVFTAVREL